MCKAIDLQDHQIKCFTYSSDQMQPKGNMYRQKKKTLKYTLSNNKSPIQLEALVDLKCCNPQLALCSV